MAHEGHGSRPANTSSANKLNSAWIEHAVKKPGNLTIQVIMECGELHLSMQVH